MGEKFFLSFHNGLCRMSHGNSLDEAIRDALQTAAATGMTCNLLGRDYAIVGSTVERKGAFLFEHASGREEILS